MMQNEHDLPKLVKPVPRVLAEIGITGTEQRTEVGGPEVMQLDNT